MKGNGMRAYGFTEAGGPDKQTFLDVPVPTPGPDEVLVRVRAAGVNPGDWRLREGSYGTNGPAVLGREVAGTITALDPHVTLVLPLDAAGDALAQVENGHATGKVVLVVP
jgi:NADPH:quinone reductase-like Zn-dependent oxidoreductase